MSPRRSQLQLLGLWILSAWGATPLAGQRKGEHGVPIVTDTGSGSETYVLLTGMVGGVAGYRRLERLLLEQGHRVIVIDPYHLSIDSADVTFAALARRVDAVLVNHGVRSARVVGHAHGAGVALRLAVIDPERVSALYFLDVGAQSSPRSNILAGALRLVPMVARIPGGRSFLRHRFVCGIRESAGRQEWLDAATQRDYTEAVLSDIDRAVALAIRLNRAEEPDSLGSLVARLRVPVTLVLGDAPHASGPEPAELAALAPLGELLRVERMPGIGHFPHEEAPADVTRYLLVPPRARSARVAVSAP